MALPAYLPEVQGSRVMLGPDGGQEASFLVNPGSADYIFGGYTINNIMTRLRLISGAWIEGMNAQASGFWPEIIFPLAQLQSTILAGVSAALGGAAGVPWGQTLGAPVSGYSSLQFKVYENNTTSGRLLELSTSYDLIGVGWILRVRGY